MSIKTHFISCRQTLNRYPSSIYFKQLLYIGTVILQVHDSLHHCMERPTHCRPITIGKNVA